jgi:hypothetical protein
MAGKWICPFPLARAAAHMLSDHLGLLPLLIALNVHLDSGDEIAFGRSVPLAFLFSRRHRTQE